MVPAMVLMYVPVFRGCARILSRCVGNDVRDGFGDRARGLRICNRCCNVVIFDTGFDLGINLNREHTCDDGEDANMCFTEIQGKSGVNAKTLQMRRSFVCIY